MKTDAGDDSGNELDQALRAAFRPEKEPESVLARLDPGGRALRGPPLLTEPAEAAPAILKARAGSEGRYQIVGEIARGGIGVVLKGHDVDLGRDVAMKVLREEHASSTDLVQRFVEEAQIGGQLQHPGIVPVYEMGLCSDRRPYFTMKLVRGDTLASRLAARRDPGEERSRFLSIFHAVCQTVAYAHARGVIHRDLKPSNVMVGAFGEVVVVDWGMGKVLSRGGVADEHKARADHRAQTSTVATVRTEGTGSHSVAGSIMGTPAYMAPEQARGRVDALDERADVFALGAILCEILTGLPAYVGPPEQAMKGAAEGRIDEAVVRLAASDADRELTELARRCLAPSAADRPKSASVVSTEVASYLESLESKRREAEVEVARATVRAAEERKRRRLHVALAAAVVVVLTLGGGGWYLYDAQRRRRAEEGARHVADALDQAMLLRARAAEAGVGRDAAPWAEALSAVRRADALARSMDAGNAARERASKALADLEREHRDRETSRKLEEIRLSDRADYANAVRASPAYAEAFRTYGIDAERMTPEDAARAIRASAIAPRLIVALDEWAAAVPQDTRTRLESIVALADPDLWRARMRTSTSPEELRSLATDPAIDRQPVESRVRLAVRMHDAGEHAAAMSIARAAQEDHPGDLWANYLCGFLCMQVVPADGASAVRYYATAVALQPSWAGPLRQLGLTLSQQGRLDEGITACGKAVSLDPESITARIHLGEVLCTRGDPAKGDFQTALRMGREALELAKRQPTSRESRAGVHNMMGSALDGSGDMVGARSEYARALEHDPNNPGAHMRWGSNLMRTGEIDAAIAHFRDALASKSGFPTSAHLGGAWWQLGRALVYKSDWDGAIAAFREAIPFDRSLYSDLGAVHLYAGDLDAALAALREALKVNASDPEIHVNLGHVLGKKGAREAEISAYREALHIAPEFTPARHNLQTALQAQRSSLLEPRLGDFLAGRVEPANAREALDLAHLLSEKRFFAKSAEMYVRALGTLPAPYEDGGGHFNAAESAAMASTGKGADGASLSQDAKVRWRRRAVEWLLKEVAYLARRKDVDPRGVSMALDNLLYQSWAASIRDAESVVRLPADEQQVIRALWEEARALQAALRPR